MDRRIQPQKVYVAQASSHYGYSGQVLHFRVLVSPEDRWPSEGITDVRQPREPERMFQIAIAT
jgi:hypothetical protein